MDDQQHVVARTANCVVVKLAPRDFQAVCTVPECSWVGDRWTVPSDARFEAERHDAGF